MSIWGIANLSFRFLLPYRKCCHLIKGIAKQLEMKSEFVWFQPGSTLPVSQSASQPITQSIGGLT